MVDAPIPQLRQRARSAERSFFQQHPSNQGEVGSDEGAQDDVAGHPSSPGGVCNTYRAVHFGSVKPTDCEGTDQGSTPMMILLERQQQASGVQEDGGE